MEYINEGKLIANGITINFNDFLLFLLIEEGEAITMLKISASQTLISNNNNNNNNNNNKILKMKLNLWLTAPKGATPLN